MGVFVIQEHRLLEDSIVDAKAQVRAAGWTAVFSAARAGRGARGPACGGVAIMAKSPFGLKEIRPQKPCPEWTSGRWLAATVGGVGRPLLVCTVYGHVNENGGRCNLQLRHELAEFTQEFRGGSGSLQGIGTNRSRIWLPSRFGGLLGRH